MAMAFASLWGKQLRAQEFTRGVGVYPGDPKEDFSPTLVPGGGVYRNLALHRPAYQSSAYDYNLTAQLITDGIKDTEAPRWIAVSTSDQGVLKRNQREWLVDDNWVSTLDLRGRSVWIQFELGGAAPPPVGRLEVDATVHAAEADNQEVTCTAFGSQDGKTWTELGHGSALVHPSGEFHPAIPFTAPTASRYYKLQFDNARPLSWQIGEVRFFNKDKRVRVGGPYDFTSAWMAGGQGEEWVYVDLGVSSEIDRIALTWISRAAEGAIQVSDNAQTWSTIHALDSSDIHLAQPAHARYVRVLMTKPASTDGYLLSELEVFGRGGLVAQPKPIPSTAGPRPPLAGNWKLQRDSLVSAAGPVLSRPGFADESWTPATVPGTILASYLNAGAIADPNFSDNQLTVSDSFFYADFWYRNEFMAPPASPGRRLWLNFDGVNWKAEVWLNGAKLGQMDGAFLRGRFDVTGKLRPGQKNLVAVRVLKNATPGSVKEKTFQDPDKNGGALGADNPTYHASIGWDWIPTIRGRNTGIWNDVYLTSTGGVTVENPGIATKLPLPDTSRAEVTLEATLVNHDAKPVTGALQGKFGDTAFEIPVSIDSSASTTVSKTLTLENPKLWWPAGYGDQNLYHVELRFNDSDTKQFDAGVRQFTYSEENNTLRIWINGRRFVPRGGNWGFGESMLRYRGREYEAAMRYHRDMHFNMVRNWVGQIGDDEFYEAADRNGIVIMQDFWLANPWDGPDPNDNAMFAANARDTIQRIRTHPSLGLYCGRNEGYPLKPLDDSLRAALKQLHPDIQYIGSSADDVVSGHGPYSEQPLMLYFTQRASPKFHSEMGMPNIVSMDSLRQMMKPEDMWPLGRVWGLHDFCLHGAQGGSSFLDRIQRAYGGADNIEDWVTLAQFVNYEGHRAMFEAQSRNRMGLLIWMSHPTWPSMVWQTYDYYLDPTAGYFGAKKGAEPLHIQWNPATKMIEVVNYSAGNLTGLTAVVEIMNLDGSVQWKREATLDSAEDSVSSPIPLELPATLTPVYFIRARLRQEDRIVSSNFYWAGLNENDFTAIRQLPKVKIQASTTAAQSPDSGRWTLETELRNTSAAPVLMVRIKAIRERMGDRILPALYSDNYVSLMPGETVHLTTTIENADTRGERPAIAVEGFNIER